MIVDREALSAAFDTIDAAFDDLVRHDCDAWLRVLSTPALFGRPGRVQPRAFMRAQLRISSPGQVRNLPTPGVDGGWVCGSGVTGSFV